MGGVRRRLAEGERRRNDPRAPRLRVVYLRDVIVRHYLLVRGDLLVVEDGGAEDVGGFQGWHPRGGLAGGEVLVEEGVEGVALTDAGAGVGVRLLGIEVRSADRGAEAG